MTEEELSIQIEQELLRAMGVGVYRYVLGMPYPIKEIDPTKTKDKRKDEQGIW